MSTDDNTTLVQSALVRSTCTAADRTPRGFSAVHLIKHRFSPPVSVEIIHLRKWGEADGRRCYRLCTRPLLGGKPTPQMSANWRMTPEPTRQRLCTSKPATTVPPIAFYGSDCPTCQPRYRGTNRRVSVCCLPLSRLGFVRLS